MTDLETVPPRWCLEDYERPWTMNSERTWHWSKRAKVTKATRERFFWLAKAEQIPKLSKVSIDVIPLLPNRHGVPDVGACYPAAKAAIDGLVDAGVLEDDSDEFITRISFYAALQSKNTGLRLVITDRS